MDEQEANAVAEKLIEGSKDSKGCRVWGGPRSLGQFFVNGKRYRAHNMSYHLFVRPLPKGWIVKNLPDCERNCIKPEHLSLVRHPRAVNEPAPPLTSSLTHCSEGHRIFSQSGICIRCAREIKRSRAAENPAR